MRHRIIVATAIVASLAGCGAISSLVPSQADPTIVAKINYVCAYSGLFKFVDSRAALVIPVPGAVLAADLVNAGVDRICLHPEAVAQGIGTVENLIARFRSDGKM